MKPVFIAIAFLTCFFMLTTYAVEKLALQEKKTCEKLGGIMLRTRSQSVCVSKDVVIREMKP